MKDKSIRIKVIKSEVEEAIADEPVFEESAVEETTFISRVAVPADIWQKIAKNCLYILTGLLPLFFIPLTIAPIDLNKQILAAILISAAFLCYLIGSLNRREIVYPKSFVGVGVLGLLFFVFLSSLFSPSSDNAIFGGLIRPDSLFSFLLAGLTLFLASVYLKKHDLPRLAICFFGGLILAALFGLVEIFGFFGLNFNIIGSITGWGIFVGFGLVLIIAALINLKFEKREKVILAVSGLLLFFCLLVLNIQLLWLGLALAMVLLSLLKFSAKAEFNLPLIVIIISVFMILIGSRFPILANVPLEVRPGLSSTLSVAKGMLSGIRHILVGSGPASFSYGWRLFRPGALNQTIFWSTTFNQGVSFAATLLVTLGILGALAFLFWIFSFGRELFKKLPLQEPYLVIISTGLCFLLINLFVYPLFFVQLIFIFLLLGLFIGDSEKNYEMNFYSGEGAQKAKKLSAFLLTIICLAFVFFGIYVVGQKYVAAVYYQKGLTDSSLDNSINYFNRALNLDYRNDVYARTLSNALSLKANQIGLTPVSADNAQVLAGQLQNAVASAVNLGNQAAQMNPAESFNWSNLGNIYENIIPINGAEAFAEKYYNQAISFDPQNPQGFVDLARMWVVSADRNQNRDTSYTEKLNKAQVYLEKAISMKGDYSAAHYLMAQIYVREGDVKGTIRKLVDLVNINPNDTGLLFQLGVLYYRNNQMAQAQAVFERAVALDQNYSNARYFLGLIYDGQSQTQKAIDQFQKIEVLNPDNAEVKKILDNLRSGRAALSGIVPPAPAPENRTQTPVESKQ